MHKFSQTIAIVLGVMIASTAFTASAQQAGKQAAHARHEGFEKLGDAFEKLEKQVKKSKPDAAVVQREAGQVLALGKESANWFPAGSGPGNGFKTHVRAEVWTQTAAFNELQEKFLAAAVKLNETAAQGDMSKVAAEVEHTGEACGECHKKFRKESSLFSIFSGD